MLNVSLRSLEGGAGVFQEQEEDCFKLKDIVNEELQGSMASDAVAMLSSSCEPSQCYDNEMKRSFRGSRDQLLASGEGLASSRERLIGSKDDLTSSREGLKPSSRVAIPEEAASASAIEPIEDIDVGNIEPNLVIDEETKDSEDEKEEVDDEAKDEDSKKHDAEDNHGKQSEDELHSDFTVEKVYEVDDEAKDEDSKKHDAEDNHGKLQSPISTPSPEVPKRMIRPNSLVE